MTFIDLTRSPSLATRTLLQEILELFRSVLHMHLLSMRGTQPFEYVGLHRSLALRRATPSLSLKGFFVRGLPLFGILKVLTMYSTRV